MPFSPNFRCHRQNMPLMQPYLTHLQSFLPSWRARRPLILTLPLDLPIDANLLDFDRISRLTHSFFLTPLIENAILTTRKGRSSSSRLGSSAEKASRRARALWSIVKVRNPSPPRRRGSCAGDPLPSDSVPSLFVLLCEPVVVHSPWLGYS